MHTRDEVRTALDANFKGLMDCLGQLTEEELTENVVCGTWSAKDIIGHIWDWGDETIHTATAWQSRRPWQEGVAYDDAWNETHVAARRILPLISVVDGATGSHRRLMHFLDSADDATLAKIGRAPWGAEMPLVEMFYEIAGHYAEHAAELASYQERCLGTDDEHRDVGCN
ncbi:MAG TPA: DinB family protein [Anaerolineae bacterium]